MFFTVIVPCMSIVLCSETVSKIDTNKKAFQLDAYHALANCILKYPRSMYPGGGEYPPPGKDMGPEIPTPPLSYGQNDQ